jgi:hypothetical protein
VVPVTLGAIVAVKFTVWLTAEDGSDETIEVVVEVTPTACTSGAETLPVKFESPLV